MAVEAPISKFKKNNLKIYIVVCIGLAIWCAYDGYISEDWIDKHTNPDGTPQAYLVINQKAPYVLSVAALLMGVYFFMVKDKKLVADENELIISEKEKISIDSIEKIDKTKFDSKGYFVITYKDKGDNEVTCKLSDRRYDNLKAVLEHLVAKIS